jgi:hypothetical protein
MIEQATLIYRNARTSPKRAGITGVLRQPTIAESAGFVFTASGLCGFPLAGI